ncbi:MAG: hypothetical protein K2I96_17345 [Lachnospiraceae bacterium]|nr:hypothetical protein [Lachnospiraceae bacterium]
MSAQQKKKGAHQCVHQLGVVDFLLLVFPVNLAKDIAEIRVLFCIKTGEFVWSINHSQ